MNSLFLKRPKCLVLEQGSIGTLNFELCSESPQHPDLALMVFYTTASTTTPRFVVTLTHKSLDSTIQMISFYDNTQVTCDMRFEPLTQTDFLKVAHTWVESQNLSSRSWAPQLKHKPEIYSYKNFDYGTIEGYRYQFYSEVESSFENYPYLLELYAPQKIQPSMVICTEILEADLQLGIYHRHTHTISIIERPKNAQEIFS